MEAAEYSRSKEELTSTQLDDMISQLSALQYSKSTQDLTSSSLQSSRARKSRSILPSPPDSPIRSSTPTFQRVSRNDTYVSQDRTGLRRGSQPESPYVNLAISVPSISATCSPQNQVRRHATPELNRKCFDAIPLPLAKTDGNAATYDVLLDLIKTLIHVHANVRKETIKLDHKFLKEAHYQIVCKERYQYTCQGRWLISEEDTRYENMSTTTAKFTHTCQYDQNSSVSLQISKGHTIGISGGLGASGFGGNAGGSASYQYSRSHTDEQNRGQGKSKISTVEVEVPQNTAIVVKELTYKVEKTADCTIELVLKKGQTIPYTRSDKNKPHSIEVETLWKKGLKDCKWARKDDDLIYCTFTSKCRFYTTEHRMETIRLDSDLDRSRRIVEAYDHEEILEASNN